MFRAALAFLLAFTLAPVADAAECARPKELRFEVTGKIVRSEVGFTQGLEWRDGKLFESTGAVGGHSGLNTIAPDGTVTRLRDDGTRYFGEGLTILNGEIYQLTWQEHEVFVYDLAGQRQRSLRNPREGWGLTNDGTGLIFSDGSPSFYFADPATFAITREVKIKTDRPGDVIGLNELELVDGKLYGNLFQTQTIVRIDPDSGCVEARANMGSLWRSMTDADKRQVTDEQNVLNGIAYDKATGLFYVTGKRWRTIFVGRFSEPK
ncbi:MAG: glutaminyl-peptide cyclotransferase [Hyphomicrobiales bacterium]|jgi:glutamine cyclotransferase|nr:glutaminyl-peptide cyclotransferase [Hyphomicrobiales bacterium]